MLSIKSNLLSAVSLGVLPLISSGVQAQQRPNIVVFIADDLASHEIGCYGGVNVPTPNIDRIAREGVQFTNCFASISMSVPIRAALYTGLYPVHNGTYKNHQTSRSDIKSITSYFPEIGYQVWRTGKIHTTPRSVFQFDEIPGFEIDCVKETADFYTDSLKQRISNTKDPFCLFVCSTNPHAPWTVGDPSSIDPDKLVLAPILPDNREFRKIYCNYLAEVKELDRQVGAVWKLLEETGQLDNTLLMFLGEQGPQFAGGKWTSWDYGVHSAMMARYPAKIKPGSVSDVLVQYVDVLPTLTEFIGGKTDPVIEGRSFLPALFGKNEECRQWAYGIHNNVPEGSAYPIRSIRDKRYKLIVNLTPEAAYHEKHLMNSKVWTCWINGDEHAKAMAERYVHRPAIEFYDTQNDPWEL
ncbi:MAG: sulfatase, partial [Tannerella sp.]|nr:sulfatase [Tannerella sp.]